MASTVGQPYRDTYGAQTEYMEGYRESRNAEEKGKEFIVCGCYNCSCFAVWWMQSQFNNYE